MMLPLPNHECLLFCFPTPRAAFVLLHVQSPLPWGWQHSLSKSRLGQVGQSSAMKKSETSQYQTHSFNGLKPPSSN